MSDPGREPDRHDAIIKLIGASARAYLSELPALPARDAGADAELDRFRGRLPDRGSGSLEAIRTLVEHAPRAATHSAGPRYFHFVIGGVTPAALGAELLTSVLDQNAGLWNASALGSHLERLAIDWLLDLFQLPRSWTGTLTASATIANLAGLGAARTWWADRHGTDISEAGWGSLPPVPVFSSGLIHASARKALSTLGIGRDGVVTLSADATGRLDADALEDALRMLGGAPAIIIGNAGDVNSGAFDPIERMADLAERYGAWLHIDGAFGLFSRVPEPSRGLTAGIEGAHSVISDGHKWLNVAYDCGIAFVRDASLLERTFGQRNAAYLPDRDDPHPNYAFLEPSSSRRARGISTWATLQAYGREGYRAMIERHLGLAQHLASTIDAADDFERLAPVPLNIVCFRYRPPGVDEADLDALNHRLGERVLADGRVFVGTTTYAGMVAFRPAIVNWRTEAQHIDELVAVLRELGEELLRLG